MSAAAIIAASVGLIPGVANAAEPVAEPVGPKVSAPDVDLTEVAESKFKTFKSPAEKSVRTTLPAAKNKAAAPLAEGAVAGNPNLSTALTTKSTSAHGLELVTDIISEAAQLTVTVEWGDGQSDVAYASGAGPLTFKHVYAELGEYPIKVTLVDSTNNVKSEHPLPYGTAGSDFTPYAPTRLLDTREGIGAPTGKVPGRGETRVKIAGNGGIPEGVTAVALNVTVTNPASSGYITAYPGDTDRPTSSNVNFTAGQTVPNMVIVPVGKDGYVNLYNGSWNVGDSVDLIADVTGYFSQKASSGYTPMDPVRFVDTREGLGTSRGQVPARGKFTTQISGLNGVPSGITAVALNVTVTEPRSSGFLSVLPGGQSNPSVSNLNFNAGDTIANSVIVPVSADGKITIVNGSWGGATDVVIDVVGSYSQESTGAYVPLEPFRWLDTRDPEDWYHGALKGGYFKWVPFSPSPEDDGVSGYILNATATNTANNGYLSVAPDPYSFEARNNGTAGDTYAPGSSTLNWTRGKTVPNLVQAAAGEHGVVDFFNQSWEEWATTDLVVDIFGYYEND
ncbi:hypothetical protein OG625_20640 [Streptomyces sp. NBC_01351]|uniref:hypothetical protein n=1 Tax=Streptomyces sp. NBC_01351 TaxID=2903833 RepID=UPI002E2EB96A|nr:hypothetical protein [Streptomyces sp. NBC_01351]